MSTHTFCNVFVRVRVQDNTGLEKMEGVPSSTLSKLATPFTTLCCPFHLLNSIDYVRNQMMLHTTTQRDVQSEGYIFSPQDIKRNNNISERAWSFYAFIIQTPKCLEVYHSPSKVAYLL